MDFDFLGSWTWAQEGPIGSEEVGCFLSCSHVPIFTLWFPERWYEVQGGKDADLGSHLGLQGCVLSNCISFAALMTSVSADACLCHSRMGRRCFPRMTLSAHWAGSGKMKSGPQTSIGPLMSKVGSTWGLVRPTPGSSRGMLGTPECKASCRGALAFTGLLPLGDFLD